MPHSVNMSQFFYPLDGHLACFKLETITNSAAVNVGAHGDLVLFFLILQEEEEQS